MDRVRRIFVSSSEIEGTVSARLAGVQVCRMCSSAFCIFKFVSASSQNRRRPLATPLEIKRTQVGAGPHACTTAYILAVCQWKPLMTVLG